MGEPLTTGQAAAYCHVSQATVVNWIKDDRLQAYTTPGGHHRIPQADLVAFLEAHDMPIDPALNEPRGPRLLLVSDRPRIKEVAQALAENNGLQLSIAASGYEASAEVVRFDPDVVVIDGATSPDSVGLCQWISESSRDVVLVLADDGRHGVAGDILTVTSEDLAGLEGRLKELLESTRTERRSRARSRGRRDTTSRSRIQSRKDIAPASRERSGTGERSGELAPRDPHGSEGAGG